MTTDTDPLTRILNAPEHRCANCYVAQYGMKSDVLCRNEWWSKWDAEHNGERKPHDQHHGAERD